MLVLPSYTSPYQVLSSFSFLLIWLKKDKLHLLWKRLSIFLGEFYELFLSIYFVLVGYFLTFLSFLCTCSLYIRKTGCMSLIWVAKPLHPISGLSVCYYDFFFACLLFRSISCRTFLYWYNHISHIFYSIAFSFYYNTLKVLFFIPRL